MPRIHLLRLVSAFCLIVLLSYSVVAQQDYNVIQGKWMEYSDPSNLLYHHLAGEAFQLLKLEEEKMKGVKTQQQWKQRQQQKKEMIWNSIGKFSEKTPLNARITGVVQKEGYRVENLIYESLPGYLVTASLFIPDNLIEAAPAILFCSGHSAIAYRRDLYQIPLLNLVKKGFVVLAIDPVSQGERLQYYDEKENKSLIGSSTKEHSYPAPQAFLIGQSVARYFVWDGIRGIDYLVSRKEVDAKRIGVHGLSGGGTQTAYISALDERVAASAPAGYLTGYKRLLESVGVQDGEQNFYHGLAKGIDHADFLEIRAPKPTLIMATTRDFFNITGTREVFERAKNTYRILGKPDHLQMVEGDYEHGYTQNIREGMYAFFQKHLNLPGSPLEEEVALLTEKELQKTETGQLASSMKGIETVFSLNQQQFEAGKLQLEKSRTQLEPHLKKVVSKAKELSGFKAPTSIESPVFTGRTIKEGFVIEKYFIKGEGNYPVPYLLFLPEGKVEKLVFYFHPEGKSKEATGEMERLVSQGIGVIAPDLIGTGEMKPNTTLGDALLDGVSYNVWFMSVLTGRSVVGLQASDIIRLCQTMKKQFPNVEIVAVAKGEMSPAVLHAASFYQGIERVALLNPYYSYESVISNQFYKPSYVFSMVAGALPAYDLPDLAATLAPRKLLINGMVDAKGTQLKADEFPNLYSVVQQNYRLKKAVSFLKMEADLDHQGLLAKWVLEK